MSYSTEFDALLADGVSISGLSSVSTDGYATPVYGSASTYKARVVRKQTLVRSFAGTEELSQMTVWVASTTTFSPSAEISVNGSTQGPLMALEAVPDEDGVHHMKAYF
jgi:hypothetical protein